MSLAITLNGIQSVQKNAGKIGEVTTEIHNAHDNFNVFAVVGYGDLAESLPGSAWNYNTGPSRPTWSSAVFRYRNDNLLWRSYSNKFSNNYPSILNVLKE